jgi:molecular chaperone DnaJ
MRVSGKGQAVKGGQNGDLYIELRVKPDKLFSREGDLILSKEHINIVDASLGCELKVKTIDGPVNIKIPAGTQSGTDFKINSRGVPHYGRSTRGAHIVTIVVDTPTNLTHQQKEALENFKSVKSKKGFWR